jgi:hypothetical protein
MERKIYKFSRMSDRQGFIDDLMARDPKIRYATSEAPKEENVEMEYLVAVEVPCQSNLQET